MMEKSENNPEEASVKPIRPRRAWVSTLLYIALLVSAVFAAFQIHIYINRRKVLDHPPVDEHITNVHEGDLNMKGLTDHPGALLQQLGLRDVAAEPPIKPKSDWKKLQAMGRIHPFDKKMVELNWAYLSPEDAATLLTYCRGQLAEAEMQGQPLDKDQRVWLFRKDGDRVFLRITDGAESGSVIRMVHSRKGQEGDFAPEPETSPITRPAAAQPAASYIAIRLKRSLKEGAVIQPDDIMPINLPAKTASVWPKPMAWVSRAVVVGRMPTARAIKAGDVLQWADFVPPDEMMDSTGDPDGEMPEIDDDMPPGEMDEEAADESDSPSE